MADGTSEVARAIAQLTTALIEAMTKLSIALLERRAQRLREAAQQGEQAARQERARLARHRAADAAIWQRTASPVWWRKATADQIAQAWRAVTTWHQVDADAAGTRQAMAERLRRRGVDVAEDLSANPGDAQWLHTALHLAEAEREEQIAFSADLDTDAELANELLWHPDEQPREQRRQPSRNAGQVVDAGGEIVWGPDEQPRPPAQDQDRSRVNGKEAPLGGTVAAAEATAAAVTTTVAIANTRQQPETSELQSKAAQTAVATEPNRPYQLPTDQQDRMAGMLRQAWSEDPGRAERILADGAWPTLATSMHRLDAAGKDVPGLLRGLNAETTDSSIPAVTTAWALRTAAAGPAARQRVADSRQAHRTRLELVRSKASEQQAMAEPGDAAEPQAADADDTTAAKLLAQAFPESIRDALNRQRQVPATVGSGAPATRGRRTDRELAGQHER